MIPSSRRLFAQRGEASPAGLILLLLVLSISWLLWSGLYKPLLIGLGLFSCVLTTYLATRMGFFRHQAVFQAIPQLPSYLWWLLKEIISSSLDVARVVLSPSLPVSPTIVRLKATSGSDSAQVILGNAITLSPGTVTIDVHEGELQVHCLTKAGAEAIRSGEANRRTANLGLD